MIKLFNECNLQQNGLPTVSTGTAPYVSVITIGKSGSLISDCDAERRREFLKDTEEKEMNLRKYQEGNQICFQQTPQTIKRVDPNNPINRINRIIEPINHIKRFNKIYINVE